MLALLVVTGLELVKGSTLTRGQEGTSVGRVLERAPADEPTRDHGADGHHRADDHRGDHHHDERVVVGGDLEQRRVVHRVQQFAQREPGRGVQLRGPDDDRGARQLTPTALVSG